jgi:ADP-heptose:LPS heptosyltransferase/GT2 family glycosyltransferase
MDQDLAPEVSELPFLLEIEQPADGGSFSAGGPLTGHGFVLGPEKILSIIVLLNGTRLCQATIGIGRSDVAEAYPEYPGCDRAGFVFWATLPSMISCQAMLRFDVRSTSGSHLWEMPIQVIGNAPPQANRGAPLPRLEPIRLELEEVMVGTAGHLHVRGWTVGVLPTKSVEVLLGDVPLGWADILQVREDVARSLSSYVHAVRPGFSFDADLPLADTPRVERLSVVVTDVAGYGRTASVMIEVPSRKGTPVRPMPEAMLARLEEARVSERGILRVRGWAVSLADIEHVTVFLGDAALGAAQAFLPRNDVAEAHPEYPNASLSGFMLQQEIDDAQLGGEVRVVVSAVGGIRRELTAAVAVPASIRRAQTREVTHCFFDSVSLTEDGVLSGIGWAVCPTGVEAIALALGEHDAGLAEIGLDRPDVGNRFSSIPSARRAGFRFGVTLPGRFEGEHILQLTVRGLAGEQHSVLQPVRAIGVQEAAAEPVAADTEAIKFYLDTPALRDGRAVEPVRGFMVLNGWAVSRAGIDVIEVTVDGHSQGNAYYGIRREEVQAAFPERDALLSGFAMLIPPQVLKKGHHDVQLVLRDKAGHVEQTAFSVEAEPVAEGPGPWQLRAKIPRSEIDLQRAILAACGWHPAWCLLLPLADDAPQSIEAARQTLASLRYQAWPDWRLRVAVPAALDRAAVAAALLAELEEFAGRVDVVSDDPARLLGGMIAQDGMMAVLAPGDRLGEDALLEMSVEAAVQADGGGRADFLYSDERRTDPADGVVKAFFKPDFSPDLLLSSNYIGRLWAASPALLDRVGMTLGDLAAHGGYDAVLRLTEAAAGIVHVRKVLCARGNVVEAADSERRALERAAQRRGIAADVLPGCIEGSWRFRREILASGMVSIIMPTIASRGLVEITIESIRAKTAWLSYEIIVLDNIVAGGDPEKLYWKNWLRDNADTVIDIDEAFNWSRFNNRGAERARGEFLLFLNDDIEILDENWLHALVEHAQRPEVGVVGPQLLYPDGSVQHAGIFLSRSVGRHAFRFYPRDEPGPFGLALTQRNVIGVTGACMLMRRSVFDELGGFDEDFSVINNDLDFSLRLQRSGRLVVYTPHATMIHHEMVSRSKLKDVFNSEKFDALWKDRFLQGDPYFHPMLTSDYDDYLSEPEPLRQFQVGHPLVAREDVRRILAVKVDHIGDFVAAFPAFRRIKQHFPNAELCVLAARASLSLAAMEPAIDRVEEFNFFHARSELGRLASAEQELLDLQARLAPFRFDLALDLRRQGDTRKILQHSGARWLAGFDQDYANPWLDMAVEFEGDVARNFKRLHVSDSLVQFVDTVARACEADRRGLHNPPSADAARAEFFATQGTQEIAPALFARPVVCVHTGAGAVNKQWPAKSFAGLIDLLVGTLAVNVMIIGGPDEAPFAAEVMADVRRPGQVFSLVGKTSLKTLPKALLACDLYVGNDSGPKHMAAALGVPTIGIHSGSVDAGEWGPMGEQTLTIRRDMTCGPCYIAYAEDCPRSMACLHGIAVGDVFRACQRMLALRRPAGLAA